MARTFKFTIDGSIFHANMVDNPLVDKIAVMCPFEADYERYTEHEYFTRLPEGASQDGCELTHIASKNQVFYFQGWNAFTILFDDFNTSPYDVVRLGEMVEDVVPQLKHSGETVRIGCEVEE